MQECVDGYAHEVAIGAHGFTYLGSQGLSGKVKVAAFDATATAADLLRSGTIDMVVAQKPADMGYLGVLLAGRGQLPEAEQLIDTYTRIKSLSDQDLVTRLQPIGNALKKLSRTDPTLSNSGFQDMIQSGKYLGGMSREERENLLMSEFVKLAIGKTSFLDRVP